VNENVKRRQTSWELFHLTECMMRFVYKPKINAARENKGNYIDPEYQP
jgi:hypothetical protein